MIIRKPYAFLIKNFKKIHIALLILCLYVAYRLFDVSSFINDFMQYGIYDFYSDPITSHITTFMMFAVFLIIIGSFSLCMLLRHKKKPWKVYLVPFIEYVVLFFVLNMIKSFFNEYSADIETTDLRMSRDLLMMFLVVQFPAIGIFIMRIFGIDIQKFNFNSDQEFLELSEADREEIEISLNVDKNTFKRTFKRLLRNLGYFYEEHKFICRSIIVVIFGVILYHSYIFIFVTNKTYKMGQEYSIDGYTFVINKAYITNKDYTGTVISNKSNFVVVDVSITNNSAARVVNLNYFHLKNSSNDYVTTQTTYATEFQDLGSTYTSTYEIKRNETLNCIIVYKVDKKLSKNKFVLFYQETTGIHKLRKIKLDIYDVSKIIENKELSLGDEMPVNIYNKTDSISFDSFDFFDEIVYETRTCTTSSCTAKANTLRASANYKIMEIDFGSEEYVAKNMIDFLNKYGTLIYKDKDGKDKRLVFNFPISKNYYGKAIYLQVPNEFADAQEYRFEFIIRNNKYVYNLGGI